MNGWEKLTDKKNCKKFFTPQKIKEIRKIISLENENEEHVNSIISQLKLEEYRNVQLQIVTDEIFKKPFMGRALAQKILR